MQLSYFKFLFKVAEKLFPKHLNHIVKKIGKIIFAHFIDMQAEPTKALRWIGSTITQLEVGMA